MSQRDWNLRSIPLSDIIRYWNSSIAMIFLPGLDSTKKLIASDQLSNLLMLDPVASLMASVTIQMLLGHNPIPGELLFYDGKGMTLDKVPVERSPGCPVCGKGEKGLGIG